MLFSRPAFYIYYYNAYFNQIYTTMTKKDNFNENNIYEITL